MKCACVKDINRKDTCHLHGGIKNDKIVYFDKSHN